MSNEQIIAQLILNGLQQMLAYQRVLANAQQQGRPVSDADIDALGEQGDAIRAAARAEADRQRAE